MVPSDLSSFGATTKEETNEDSRRQELQENLNYSWCEDFVKNQQSIEDQPVARMTRMAKKARLCSPTPISIKKCVNISGTSTPQGQHAPFPAVCNHSFTMFLPVEHMDDDVSLPINYCADEKYNEVLHAIEFDEDVEENLDLLALEAEILCSPVQSHQSVFGAPPNLGTSSLGTRF